MNAANADQRRAITRDEWLAEGRAKFGEDTKQWKFECPHCHEAQTLQDFIDAEVKEPDTLFFFSCIGRWADGRGCDWTLGGLFRLHMTEVIIEGSDPVPVMEWAND